MQNSIIIYDLIPAEKTLDKLADQLYTLNQQYNNGLVSSEQYTHAASVIELKQEKAIKLWERQSGLCWWTGLSKDKIKRGSSEQTRMPIINIKNTPQDDDRRSLSLGGWALLWLVVILILGM